MLALSAENIEQLLTRRSGVWVELLETADRGEDSLIRVQLFGDEYRLMPISAKRTLADRELFFGVRGKPQGWIGRPMLWWGEVSGPLRFRKGNAIADII